MEGALIIKLENGRWFVNDKPLHELTPNEKQSLDHFFSDFKNCLEKANNKLSSLRAKSLKENNHQFN